MTSAQTIIAWISGNVGNPIDTERARRALIDAGSRASSTEPFSAALAFCDALDVKGATGVQLAQLRASLPLALAGELALEHKDAAT
jgi:hypothetical protein